MENPRVSIVMPAYNREKYISSAIESILEQSFNDFELLIVDDCSIDRTVQIIQGYNDQRIKLIRNENNRGVAASRNIGYRNARGEYIAIADSDDINHPERILKKVNFLDENKNIDVVSCWYQEIDSLEINRKIIKFSNKDSEIRANWIFNPGVSSFMMFRKRNIEEHNLLFHKETYKAAVDYQWYTSLKKDIKLYCLPEVLYFYRRHENQISSNGYSVQQQFADEIRLGQLKKIGLIPTKEQFEIHQWLSRNLEKEISNNLLIDVIDWCERIRDANELYNQFDNQSLNIVLTKKIIGILNSEPIYSTNRNEIFINSLFSKYLQDRVTPFNSRKVKNIIENVRGKSIFIFGTKRMGYEVKKVLDKCSTEVKYFIDNNKMTHGKKIEECVIVSPTELINMKNVAIIISIISDAKFEVKRQLIEKYSVDEESIYLLEDLQG